MRRQDSGAAPERSAASCSTNRASLRPAEAALVRLTEQRESESASALTCSCSSGQNRQLSLGPSA